MTDAEETEVEALRDTIAELREQLYDLENDKRDVENELKALESEKDSSEIERLKSENACMTLIDVCEKLTSSDPLVAYDLREAIAECRRMFTEQSGHASES